MEAKAKLGWLSLVLIALVGVGWWITRPTDRMEYQVPQQHLDEAKKGKIDERRFAGKEEEGGSHGTGTSHEAPGGADMERLGLAKPAQPAQAPEMKAQGIGPIGDRATH